MSAICKALGARTPDDIIIEGDGQALTAQELLNGIETLGTLLDAMGIDRLGLLADNSVAWITMDLACQEAKICLLPMPAFFSDGQLANSLQSVGVDCVLTDQPERVAGLTDVETLPLNQELLDGLTLLRILHPGRHELPPGTHKVTFTSGSTGAPRGVCLSSAQQISVGRALYAAVQIRAPRHLCLLPLSTLLENVGGVYHSILAGGSVSVPPEAERGFSGSAGLDMHSMLQTIFRHRPTSIILLPQMLVGLVAALEAGWQPPAELKFAAVGGAKVAPELIEQARNLGLPVYEGYGLSETSSVACLNHPGEDRIGSVGKPLAHVDVRMQADEILIGGNTFLGYVGQPESWGMDAVFTGDIGTCDPDGFVHLHGRRKNILITNLGRNISPEWLESEVLANPEIAQCVVVGDDRPYCVALLTPANPDLPDERIRALLDEVNRKLPDYARIQRWHRMAQLLSPASGLWTDNGRPRRAEISTALEDIIDSLYVNTSNAESASVATAVISGVPI